MSIEVSFSQDDETKSAAFAHICRRIKARAKGNFLHQALAFILVISAWILLLSLYAVSDESGFSENFRWLIGSLAGLVLSSVGMSLSAQRLAKIGVMRNQFQNKIDIIKLRVDDKGIFMSWQHGTTSFDWPLVVSLDQDQAYFYLVSLMENCIAIRKSEIQPFIELSKFNAYFESRIPA